MRGVEVGIVVHERGERDGRDGIGMWVERAGWVTVRECQR